MQVLWAPWRMEYIKSADMEGECIFCLFPKYDPKKDEENLILYRGKEVYILMNRYPYNNGHVMVIPNRHTGTLSELPPAVLADVMKYTAASVDIFKKLFNADGANCGMNIGRVAGAGVVDHVHMHIVPRWNGDHNFMPVLADTKSMPEYLGETYAKLAPEFKKLVKGV